MSKAKLTAAEWELVKDAPYWIEAALAAADKKATPSVSKKEAQAVHQARQSYKSSNALVRDIMADDSPRAKAIENASKADADVALGRIAAIVEAKLGADDLDALNDFLLEVGERVAGAAKENVLGLGDEVSKKEAAALKELAVVLRATDAQKKARKEQAQAAQTAHAAQSAQAAQQAQQAREEMAAQAKADQARKEAEARAKADQARREAEAEAKQKAEARERLEKAREEAEERQKEAAAKDRLEKAREEAEERQKEALAKREAAKAEEERAAAEAKAAEEAARAEAEAKAAAEREAAAKQAQAAPRFTEFIAEHTVVAGENLSFISQRYYGTQANFRLIYEANRDVIGDNMNLIRPGQKLRIPKL